jgi:hypothetical protein
MLTGRGNGFTDAAARALAQAAAVTFVPAGRTIHTSDGPCDFLRLLVCGVAKVRCAGAHPRAVDLYYVRAGAFLSLPRPTTGVALWQASFVAHENCTIALIALNRASDVLRQLPPDALVRLLGSTWRTAARRLCSKAVMLTMPLPGRVRSELASLAHELGHAHAHGVTIDTPMTCHDLALLTGGSRSNVSRVMGTLRRAGLILRSGGRLTIRVSLHQPPNVPVRDGSASRSGDTLRRDERSSRRPSILTTRSISTPRQLTSSQVTMPNRGHQSEPRG